jgi:hypothetical protein
MSDEIVIINFLTKIENIQSIPVPESNQEYMSDFIGKRVLITIRRNVKSTEINDTIFKDSK